MTKDKADKIEEVQLPEYEFAFSVIKDRSGNLGIKSMKDGEKVSTQQIYDACRSIMRNIDNQDIANAVTMQLIAMTQQGAQPQTKGGIVIPQPGQKV